MPARRAAPKTALGEALRKARDARGWTGEYLASLLPGVRMPMISYWELGKRKPQVDDLHKLSRVLATSVSHQRQLLAEWKRLGDYTDPVEEQPADEIPDMTIQGAMFRGLGLIVDSIEDESLREELVRDAKVLVESYRARSGVVQLRYHRKAPPPSAQIALAPSGQSDGDG